jgi:F0F1-type ATP synthase membrane subunit b/b'
MDNTEVLGHLLEIEAEASALVDDAQAEADKRVLEAEKQNQAALEKRYCDESERLENEYLALKQKIRQEYQVELDAYREKLDSARPDANRFSALLDKFIAEEGR